MGSKNKVRKHVQIPEDVIHLVESYAEERGINFSDALTELILNPLFEQLNVTSIIKVLKDYEKAMCRAIMLEIEGKQRALEHLNELKAQLKERFDNLSQDMTSEDIRVKLSIIYDFFDRHGFDKDLLIQQYFDILQDIRAWWKQTFGQPFDIEEFFEEVWLNDELDKDEAIDKYLKKYYLTKV